MKQHLTRKIAAVAAMFAVLFAASWAVGLWSTTGTGSGNAKALTATTVTVTAATGAADLYPGFTGGGVYFSLTNTNPYAVEFTSMAPGTVTSSNPGACPASNVTARSATGLALPVGPATTTGTLSIANVVTMSAAAPDGCQGVTFTIALTVTGSQV